MKETFLQRSCLENKIAEEFLEDIFELLLSCLTHNYLLMKNIYNFNDLLSMLNFSNIFFYCY